MAKHVLSVLDLGADNFKNLIQEGVKLSKDINQFSGTLDGKIVGIYFRGYSTRTRTSFSVGALKMGAKIISYGPNDLQINTGETIEDTVKVLSSFIDALVIRTNDTIEEMNAMANQGKMSIINAMSENEHPTQIIGDFVTIINNLGSLEGKKILYIGEGNNTTEALANAVALTPHLHLTIVTPEKYGLSENTINKVAQLAKKSDAFIEQHHDLNSLKKEFDVIYTTRWQTMGVPKDNPNWKEIFAPFKVTTDFMNKVSKDDKTIFLHDLPAVREEEVSNNVLDGQQSRAFEQAANKLIGAMLILKWCLAD